jgi:hypothetical protein
VVVDRAKKHRFAQVGRCVLSRCAREIARCHAVIAALLAFDGGRELRLGCLWQVEERPRCGECAPQQVIG